MVFRKLVMTRMYNGVARRREGVVIVKSEKDPIR